MNESVKFRHKCDSTVNPKFNEDGSRNEEYQEHIRKEYEVGSDVRWLPLHEESPDKARLGLSQPTGRVCAVTSCPDCGEQVIVTTEA